MFPIQIAVIFLLLFLFFFYFFVFAFFPLSLNTKFQGSELRVRGPVGFVSPASAEICSINGCTFSLRWLQNLICSHLQGTLVLSILR